LWQPGPDARYVRAEAGQDLAHFLVGHTGKKLSVRAARRLLEAGGCRVNGRVETFGSRVLKHGDVVEFFLPEDHEHVFDRRRILFDDGGVIAYDKPPFLPVTPTDGPKSWSLWDILSAQLGDLHAVHRLDADTSGIVLFARTPMIAERLEAMFRDHAVEKTYLAIVRGHPPEAGERRSYLVKVESRRGFEKWASGRGADAREAITAWRVLERLGRYASLVEVTPKTGRYHQIRIHFSEMGFPLYGDRLYSDRQDPVHCTRHLLHSCRVKLPHPAGGPSIDIEAGLPREFAETAMRLKKL
jgi:23S rRNA pseudouridine955/2504/2580 synthase/23S rRNA pseudouridine1911/1915/1917 synthase